MVDLTCLAGPGVMWPGRAWLDVHGSVWCDVAVQVLECGEVRAGSVVAGKEYGALIDAERVRVHRRKMYKGGVDE